MHPDRLRRVSDYRGTVVYRVNTSRKQGGTRRTEEDEEDVE